MAKKLTDTDARTIGPEAEAGATVTVPPAREDFPNPKANAGKPPQQAAESIPDYADRILHVYRQYRELYIDPSGGTYTCDTPPAFRSNTTLYRNPYYKS